jgi:very-short-patch-repair endonuclease
MRSIFRVGEPTVKVKREILSRSRSLRANATDHERKLWSKLRALNRLGHHLRRQAPFQAYFLDFVEHRAKLVIELDGSQHGEAGQISKDQQRDAALRNEGYLVLRFWNREIDEDMDAIVDTVARHLRERSPHPKNPSDFSTSPQRGG